MLLSHETKWIICMWDIRGDSIIETATLLKMTLKDVKATIAECKEDGFYDKVRRHIEYFDMVNAKNGIDAFCFNLTKKAKNSVDRKVGRKCKQKAHTKKKP